MMWREAILLSALLATPALASGPDIHVDVPPDRPGLEVNVVEHDFPSGASSGWHIHHGVEIAYILEGDFDLIVGTGPIQHFHKGDSVRIDRDVPHRATNVGIGPGALLITYLKDKAGPWKIPVPTP